MGPALRSVLGIALSGAGSALWLLQQKPPDPFELLWKVGGGWSCSMGVEWGTLGYSSAGAIPGSVLWCRLAPIVLAHKPHCCWHSLGPASTAGSAGSQPSCARSWAHKATSADPLKSRTWTLVPPRPRMLAKLGATECWAPWPQAPTVICWDALQELSLQSSHNT